MMAAEMERRFDMMTYGLIEWETSLTPTIVVGDDTFAVRHAIVGALKNAFPKRMTVDADLDFLGEYPYPDQDASEDELITWLCELREVATVPWVTVLGDDDVVRA